MNNASILGLFLIVTFVQGLDAFAEDEFVTIGGKVTQFDDKGNEYKSLPNVKITVYRGGGVILPEAKMTADDGTFSFLIRRGSPFRVAFFKDRHWVPEVTPALNGSETPQTFSITMRTVDNYITGKERLPLRTKIDAIHKDFSRADSKEDEFTSLLQEMLKENLE